MENNEMNNTYENNSEREMQTNSGYTQSYPQASETEQSSSEQSVQKETYQYDSQAPESSSYSAPQNIYSHSANDSVRPEQTSSYGSSDQSRQEQTPSYGNSDYARPYTVPYSATPYGAANSQSAPKKRSGSGRTAALIAGTLALALVVGVGGGVLGSHLAQKDTASVSESTASSSKTSNEASSSGKTDVQPQTSGSLNITKASDTETKPTNIQEVTAKVKDAVVEITTETTEYDSFYGQYVSQAAGSGVIISEDGYILTNNHVIDGASTITVRLTNAKTYEAKLIGKDATLDVALLKIEEKGLTAATFGDSSTLNVGQDAIAIGNPLGRLGGTVTNGIISALDREIQIDGKTMNLLQTNAAINPGNSGGGLFDANGNLIGLVVAKSSSSGSGTSVEGLGFAIPVNDIVDVLDDLKTKGHVTGRGNLGINIVTINSENSMFMYRVNKMGVYISAVTNGSAADNAGLKVGDLILEFNGKEISEGSDLTSAVSKLKAGTKVKIKIERDGKEQTIEVTLGEKAYEEESSENTQQNRNSNNLPNGSYFFGDNDDFFGMG